jgi:4-alpha-glucanotransferase
LSVSRARVVMASLENLWLERQPQNIPGTSEEHPNWRRKARYSFEAFSQMPEVLDTLREVNRLRKQRGNL